jgi:hypothetical protein
VTTDIIIILKVGLQFRRTVKLRFLELVTACVGISTANMSAQRIADEVVVKLNACSPLRETLRKQTLHFYALYVGNYNIQQVPLIIRKQERVSLKRCVCRATRPKTRQH